MSFGYWINGVHGGRELFFQHFSEQLHSCNWLQLKAANGLDIPYLGYAEVNVEVLGKAIPNKGILDVKDTHPWFAVKD